MPDPLPTNSLPIRYFYRRGARGRRIAVAYTYDPNSGIVRYGAAIFRPIDRRDTYIKKINRAHALERFKAAPVAFSAPPDVDPGNKWTTIEKAIRRQMVTSGCRYVNPGDVLD